MQMLSDFKGQTVQDDPHFPQGLVARTLVDTKIHGCWNQWILGSPKPPNLTQVVRSGGPSDAFRGQKRQLKLLVFN